jgi:hypothetical protein
VVGCCEDSNKLAAQYAVSFLRRTYLLGVSYIWHSGKTDAEKPEDRRRKRRKSSTLCEKWDSTQRTLPIYIIQIVEFIFGYKLNL